MRKPIEWVRSGGLGVGRRGCFEGVLPGIGSSAAGGCGFPDRSTGVNGEGDPNAAAAAVEDVDVDSWVGSSGFDVSVVEEGTEEASAEVIVVVAAVVDVAPVDRLDVSVLPAAVSVAVAVDVVVPGFAVAFADSIAFAGAIEAKATKVTIGRSCCWC